MSPGEFIQWVVVLVLTAVFVLPMIGGVLYGVVVGIGSIIEWFDNRGYTATCPHCKESRKRKRSRD